MKVRPLPHQVRGNSRRTALGVTVSSVERSDLLMARGARPVRTSWLHLAATGPATCVRHDLGLCLLGKSVAARQLLRPQRPRGPTLLSLAISGHDGWSVSKPDSTGAEHQDFRFTQPRIDRTANLTDGPKRRSAIRNLRPAWVFGIRPRKMKWPYQTVSTPPKGAKVGRLWVAADLWLIVSCRL